MRTYALCACLLGTLGACSDPTLVVDEDPFDPTELVGTDGKADSAAAVCPGAKTGTTSDGDAVAVCDALYTTAPALRPPADKLTSAVVTLYVGMVIPDGPQFVDRRGKVYVPVDASGTQIRIGSPKGLPTALRLPSNRNLYLVYRITGTLGADSDQGFTTIRLKTAKPVVFIHGKAVDGAYLGAWEGLAARRTSTSDFDRTVSKQVPVRVTFSSLEKINSLKIWDDAAHLLPDGDVYRLKGTVDNLAHGVTSSAGKCLPALSNLKTANPFDGADTGAIDLYRLAAMHFGGDQVMVFSYPQGKSGPLGGLGFNGMGVLTTLQPASFLQQDPGSTWLQVSIRPHGRPNGGLLILHPATAGGGAACN